MYIDSFNQDVTRECPFLKTKYRNLRFKYFIRNFLIKKLHNSYYGEKFTL